MPQTRQDWQLYGGHDPRSMATYTTPEAARYIRLPLRTVQNWSFGFKSYGGQPLIRIADPARRLLSFWNIAELHVLGALRYHRVRTKVLRQTIRYLGDTFESSHPLLTEKMLTDGVFIFTERKGMLINAAKSGQLAMQQVLQAHLQRIDPDVDGLAMRLFPFVRRTPSAFDNPETLMREPKIISIDPRIRFGRPVIINTSIPTEEIAERFRAGDSFAELAEEYERPAAEIEEAIRCELGQAA